MRNCSLSIASAALWFWSEILVFRTKFPAQAVPAYGRPELRPSNMNDNDPSYAFT